MSEVEISNLDGAYFNLPNADTCDCYVHLLRTSLPVLLVDIKQGKNQPRLRLSFSNPIYFEGPTEWHGANFQLGTQEELLEMWSDFWKGKVDQQVFLKNYRLFKVSLRSASPRRLEVRIVASEVRFVNSD